MLAEVGEEWQPKGATAIVMDPRDGAILALANWPRVNANALGDAPDYARQNRAIGATYEPGSTFKAFTVAGALEEGKVTPDTSVQPAAARSRSPTARSASRTRAATATLTTRQILEQSSNVGSIMIGQRLGAERFDQWVRRFGFGSPTGVDLPGEERGILLDLDDYSGSSMGNLPIGQGLAVTPMQMAAGYAAIANGGILRPPHIVERGRRRAPRRAEGPARDLRGDRRRGAPDARGRARPGRHRVRRGDRRLRARRQDRHGGEARRVRRLLEDQVRRPRSSASRRPSGRSCSSR